MLNGQSLAHVFQCLVACRVVDAPVEKLIEAHDAFRAECGLERTRPDTRGSLRADVSLPGLGHDLRQVTGEVQRTQ